MRIRILDDVIYGDQPGVLTGHDSAGAQYMLMAPTASVTVIGDADVLSGQGGDDTLLIFGQPPSTTVLGDAVRLIGDARGGDDHVAASAALEVFASGDGVAMTGHASGGDDFVSATNGVIALAIGDAEIMTGNARGGSDFVNVFSLGSDARAFGDAVLMEGSALGGDDYVSGMAWTGVGQIAGDAATMSGHAVGGNDVVATAYAHVAAPLDLYGDAITLCDYAQGGDDIVRGYGLFISTMYGDGLQLLDHAAGGNDTLVGSTGAETMWGDAATVGPSATSGADRFVFGPDTGEDMIMDYESGKDVIELRGLGFLGFEDLAGSLHATTAGVLIVLGDDDTILVLGAVQLTASDFLFD